MKIAKIFESPRALPTMNVATTLYLPIPEYIGNKFVQIKENGRELKIEIDVL